MKPHRTYRGSEHRNAKLTEAEARAIYQDRRPSKIVAYEYQVSKPTVWAIWQGRNWKHATLNQGANQ